MGKVGIIPNPLSGKDIRRLVACGMVSSNDHKINLVVKILHGLDASGVSEVVIMPDIFGIGQQAKETFFKKKKSPMDVSLLDMPILTNDEDSYKATLFMKDLGVNCIITLGGDGTNRIVAKACGKTPILPLSTGTNNVFSFMIEATVAGVAAGFVSREVLDPRLTFTECKRLDIIRGEEVIDIALIDAVVVETNNIGARAIWDVGQIKQIVQTCGSLDNIGLSSIGGCLHHVSLSDGHGISVEIGEGGSTVLAPIAPGLIKEVPVQSSRIIKIGERVPVQWFPSVLALDGERQLKLRAGDDISIRLSRPGLNVVNVHKVLRLATEKQLMSRTSRIDRT